MVDGFRAGGLDLGRERGRAAREVEGVELDSGREEGRETADGRVGVGWGLGGGWFEN